MTREEASQAACRALAVTAAGVLVLGVVPSGLLDVARSAVVGLLR